MIKGFPYSISIYIKIISRGETLVFAKVFRFGSYFAWCLDDEYNFIIMSTPYDKILKRGEESRPIKKKNNAHKANLHRISFEDSDDSSRIDIPNIFLDDREITEDIVYSPVKSPVKPNKAKQNEKPVIEKQDSFQEFKQPKSPSKRIQAIYNQPQPELEEEIAEPEPELYAHSSLSLLQVIKLNLGEFLFRDQYPLKKTIYINNNNEEQNELNQKEYLMKNKNQRELIYFSNSLELGTVLFFLVLFFRNLFGHLYIYTWVAIIVLQFLAESMILKMPIQYGTDKITMIVLLVLAIIIQVIADWLAIRKRRMWHDEQHTFRLYHHNGHVAEWVNTKTADIKAGNVYRVQPGKPFPTDCLLIHSQNSMLKIDETTILSHLVQHPSEITLKETVIKQENSPLPLSGFINYEISGPQYTDFQIVGKLNLEQPQKASHGVSMNNIALRGSINASQIEITCLALQTGIDSLFLKSLQYPFGLRKQYEYSTPYKRRTISSEVSEEIKEYEGTLLGCNLQKKVESIIFIMFLLYFLITGLGVLSKFAFSLTTPNEFFLSKSQIQIWKISIYHATNYIIMIPVLLLPMFKLFLLLSGALSEWNISRRVIELSAEVDRHKRSSSLLESASSKNEELLDNKKIVFPLQIKDYNLVPELCKVDTIVTTIDTFRDNSAYTLHSIRVKQINHNFMTNSVDNEAYGVSDQQTLKHFMSVALLTSTNRQYDYSRNQPTSYDSGIEFAAKKYFDLQKNKNARGETIIGNGTFVVKELFHIDPLYEFPYKIVFLETNTSMEQQGEENKRVLVLIRGNAKVILDKCYGKQVKFSQQSRRLEEEKGFHVELVAKLTLHIIDAMEIKNAFYSFNFDKVLFYKNLDKYISKVQSMGLLIFVNQFHQKKIGDSLKNPVLNKSIINMAGPKTSSRYSDNLTSNMMPNIIILAPPSSSSEPQFQSIHTITNLLISPYLFNLSLTEVGQKIYHEKPSDLDRMFNHLDDERILVWNGWDQKDITYTIDVMKSYGRNILFYTQKDEYMYLMKQTGFSAKGGDQGYDVSKYSDINLSSRCSISYLYLLQLIKYDSVVIRQGILSILATQIGKYTLYLVIQAINIFYTRGTALIIIKSPLFIIIEIVLFFDILYYLNWKDSERASSFNKKGSYFRQMGLVMLTKIAQGLFITFMCFYSTQTPSSSTGTPHPYQYTYFAIVFTVVHLLVIEKLFNTLSQSVSVYKIIIIVSQVILIYIGFIIVSMVDRYFYQGILWSALSAGNISVTIIACVWICLTVPALRILFSIIKSRGLKSKENKKIQ